MAPLPGGLPGPPSMAARTRLPAERPREVLRRVASFLGVLPCAAPPRQPRAVQLHLQLEVRSGL